MALVIGWRRCNTMSAQLSVEITRVILIALFGLTIGWVAGSVWMGLAVTFFLYTLSLIHI